MARSLFDSVDKCNAEEAPQGFYAVPKSRFSGGGNICHSCDWRTQCNDEKTDLLAFGHRCMAYPILAFRDGKTYQREDRQSVVFKRRIHESGGN